MVPLGISSKASSNPLFSWRIPLAIPRCSWRTRMALPRCSQQVLVPPCGRDRPPPSAHLLLVALPCSQIQESGFTNTNQLVPSEELAGKYAPLPQGNCLQISLVGKKWRRPPVCRAPPANLGFSHSEGESLRKGEKKRLGRRSSPQNGRFGGRATYCECSEELSIDQARIHGGPDNSLLGPGRRGIS